jgi:predicted RNA polymerase sigma factor
VTRRADAGEAIAAAMMPPDEFVAPAPGDEHPPAEDDTLTLLFLCCHPALSPASQLALTLRAIGGLTTAQIARAFLVPEDTSAVGCWSSGTPTFRGTAGRPAACGC